MEMTQPPLFREVYYFLASQPSRQQIMNYRPSAAAQERLRELLDLHRAGRSSTEQTAELDEFEQLEHFVRMLKLHIQELLDQA
jgi:hypothetical protein